MKKLLLYKVLCDPFNKVVVTLLRRKRQKNERKSIKEGLDSSLSMYYRLASKLLSAQSRSACNTGLVREGP